MKRLWLIVLVVWSMVPSESLAQTWSDLVAPAPGLPRSVGAYTAGCVQGAVALPPEGPGFQTMRRYRRRFFGHPTLIRYLQDLAEAATQQRLGILSIGDLGQPRGGPAPSGHASHQTGLDADIWFEREPGPRLEVAQRENPRLRSLVKSDDSGIDDSVFSQQHVALLRLAAEMPHLDRIFVNKWIKQRLCQTVTGSRAWLNKLVVWAGHDEHFHLRLYCPPGNPQC